MSNAIKLFVSTLIGLMVGFSPLPPIASSQTLESPRQARQYRSAIAGPFTSRGATSSPFVADVFEKYENADFDGSRAALEKLVDELRDQNEPVEQAAATDFMGVIFQRQGRLGDALDAHRRALRLLDGLGSVALEARLNAVNNLAIVHYLHGDYEEAEKQLVQVVDAPGVSAVTIARSLNNLGLVHEELGDFDKARGDFDKARSRAGVSDRRLRAQVLNNQARIYGREHNVLDAEPLLTQARTLARDTGDKALEANVLASWADVLTDDGQPAAALAKLDEARTVGAQTSAPLVVLEIAKARGKTLLRLGRHAEAQVELDRAVVDAQTFRVPAQQRQALALRGDLRMQLVQQGGDATQLDEAIADYRRAIEIAQTTRDRAPKEREQDFVRSVQSLYEAAIKALTRRSKPDDLEEAVSLLGGIASTALNAQLKAAIPSLRDADAAKALDGAKGVLAQEAALARQLSDARLSGAPSPEFVARLETELGQARQDVSVAVAELVQKYGAFYRAYVTISPLQFRDIKDQLPPRHLLVGYLPTQDELYIFLVSREAGVQFRQIAVTKAELDERVRAYRLLATRVGGMRADWQIDSWADAKWQPLRTETVWLYERLLAPIRDVLGAADHVILAPTGLLYYLPFHALGPYDPQAGTLRFLALDMSISYLTDNSLLKALGPPPLRSNSILALGNPPFQQPGLRPLNHAEEEVKAVKNLFGGQSVALVGPRATKPALLAALGAPTAGAAAPRGAAVAVPSRFGFVHLATHGVIDPRKPVESWLALDGTNRLVAREVPSLDLRGVNLVTLSACETALAEEKPGAELMSLAAFFGQAGAASVIVSLWPVDDLSTRDLMTAFYTALLKDARITKARALHDAQVALASRPESRHPFFWAAFALIGDWR